MKCPYFMRRVSSYRFYGLKCSARFNNGENLGTIEKWTKEERETKIKEHCNGECEKCHMYKYRANRNGEIT